MKTLPSLIVLIAAAVLPVSVHAQGTEQRSGMEATAIVGEGGVSMDGTRDNGWFGGMMLWQPTHRFTIAVSGKWIDGDLGASAVSGDISTELRLLPPSAPSIPYVRFGVGAYRATFDLPTMDRFTAMPEFYRRRVDFIATVKHRESFIDPMFVVGAGLDVPVNRHVSVRPDVRGMWVVRDGHAYQMVLVGVQLAYRIEAHPVTPSRGAR